MSKEFPYQQIRSLLLEYLAHHISGEYEVAVEGVIKLAKTKGLYSGPESRVDTHGGSSYDLDSTDRKRVPEKIRQLFWEFLVQGIIVFGSNESNPNWPNYRVTEYGEEALSKLPPSPYDPDGFLNEFRAKNENVDEVITEYLTEAIRSFNHRCFKASAVMLGCASEQAILILHNTFESAISPEPDRKKFQKSYNWTISSRFNTLKNGLEYMIESKSLPKELHELVRSDLVSIFELIRRYRNSAGHPNLLKEIRRETLFLNLTVFSEYVSQIYCLINFFKNNKASVPSKR